MSLTSWTYIEAEDLWMTPKGRLTFVALARKFKSKKSTRVDDEGSYNATLILPPGVKDTNIRKAIDEIAKQKFPGSDIFNPGKSKVKGLKCPIRKADELVADLTSKGEPVDLEGWTMILPNAYRSRPVVRNSKGEVLDEDDLAVEAYSGRWARLLVRPAAFDNESKGVKFWLEGVQLLGNDDAYGAFKRTSGDAFTPVEDEDEEI